MIGATTITEIHGREVLDSRGRPTVEVEVRVRSGRLGRAIVPSGASTGAAEAVELRDRDSSRYDGLGVRDAVRHVNELIAPAVRGMDCARQFDIDDRLLELDPTPRKEQLGANAVLGVSLGVVHAAAAALGVPLHRHIRALAESLGLVEPGCPPAMPQPMTNMISGGLHAGGNLPFQDILIMPVGLKGYAKQLESIVRVYWRLGRLLRESGYEGVLVGDEGGYGPRVGDHEEAMTLVVCAIEACGFCPGQDIALAIDVASSHFFEERRYRLSEGEDRLLDRDAMIGLLEQLVDRFPLVSIEDGLAEDDWEGWQSLTSKLGQRVQLIGDDLFATNQDRVQHGIDRRAANGLLVKLNQIGTLSETLRTMRLARRAGFTLVVSARSGESEDATIADLAVGTRAEQIKIGSVARSERLAKYNRLLRIDEEIVSSHGRPPVL